MRVPSEPFHAFCHVRTSLVCESPIRPRSEAGGGIMFIAPNGGLVAAYIL